ncbi:hypothetical protein [Actinomadura montaniterrae]|uniref:Uncharacterized protein n=1 Tax=Actinomadura montaniterrae TaxID=1803903 RepID=A0A6L3VXB7_9ACTN|nr:hypothetical protein [Actinomadura montaniterrae]KAB2384771.1 hypothetical protein F9B16_10005 [Actinomadura montaniterrae]
MTSAHPHANAQLQQLRARLDGQGFEAGIIGGKLFVIAPPTAEREGSRLIDVLAPTSRPDAYGLIWYQGEGRRTVIVTAEPRGGDGDKLWFYVDGEPLIEASHVTDAAMWIGSRLTNARAGR